MTFCWHWRDPSALAGTQGSFHAREPDAGKNTAFAIPVRAGRLDTASDAGRQLDADIGRLARELAKLQAAGVSNARAYVPLYRHMFDRLVKHHGLHNLIWVWNDVYDDTDRATYKSQIGIYRRKAAIGPAVKPVAMTENGSIPDPDRMRADGARWLWFLTWNDGRAPAGTSDKDNFWSGDYYNTAAHKTKVYHHADVITLDRLPAFLKAPQ